MQPKIICHMVSSVDGRLLVDRWTTPADGIDGKLLSGYYNQISQRFHADGWIVGRTTMEDYAQGTVRKVEKPMIDLREPFIGNRNGRDVAVVIDLQGKLHYGQDHADGDHIIAILSENVSDDYLAELYHDGISYLFTTSKRNNEGNGFQSGDLQYAMDVLGDTFGIKTLLLEGGGMTNGLFLKAGLINEISLLVYPGIDGLAGVPSIFNYLGKANERPAEGQSLRLISMESLEGGMVWLHYAVEKSPSGQ
ncbi:2-hydroxy-3-oxopropionate reductase [Dictyobacter sp. S3.2.2.5]|uniref:2-hydroxy-3-oxopropionate reductase n=1 Tax=Dictyobacter halimunensis TaxID=3026934 RepID=A0ABQ6FKS4_9CHLR|nr:2-hydroxy-3-oxopropionate reductase [Dictyobacter sp. S3.2.2.5]